jgi:AAT family amino acid transporter
MNPKGVLRMYTPMYGYSYVQWLLIGVLVSVLIFRYWPLSHAAVERLHPLAKGGILLGLCALFAVMVVQLVFQRIIGPIGVPYFSERMLEMLKINPYNAREYSSAAILFVGAMMALVIPIWSLHVYNWPERELYRPSGWLTSFLLVLFFATLGFAIILHPHFGILFYPWQQYTAAFPWWEPIFDTLSGTFNLGWMMSWTAAIWFIQVTYEGYPIRLMEKQPWRALAGIAGTFVMGMIFFFGFILLQEVVWGPPMRGGKLILAVDWRYLHAGETAMFTLFIALIHGIYFRNWPTRFPVEVNLLIRSAIIGVVTVGFYTLYYAHSPTLLGTQPGYAHPQQFPLAALSLLIALMLSHHWHFDRWPGDRALRA